MGSITGEVRLRCFDDGSLEVLRADPEVEIAQEALEQLEAWADRERVSLGDGILTIRARNGTVSYGLHDYDLLSMVWRGTRGQ